MNDDQMKVRKGEAFRLDVRSRELFARARNTMLRRTVRVVSGSDAGTEGQITNVSPGLDGGLVLTVRLDAPNHPRRRLTVDAVALGEAAKPRATSSASPYHKGGAP